MQRLTGLTLICAAAFARLVMAAPTSDEALVVHEWGTFTSFQDSKGATIAGINVDDEPVPAFVHRLKDLPIFTAGSYPATWSQGAPRCHGGVTLRLETPVLYFYPQAGFPPNQRIDVQAKFVGGWLTEFFPAAAADVPQFPHTLNGSAQGSLKWSDLRLAPAAVGNLPQTTAPVWLAPRKVRSAVVATANKEAEKYLFYRGVGHLDAPLVVRQQSEQLSLALREGEARLDRFPPVWLVRVLPNGKVWYVAAHPKASAGGIDLSLRADGDATQGNLDALRGELASALITDGLYPDEAQAMLETWKLSYFSSEGLRLFFLLPQTWTDARLPLSISTPARVTRVMMGRIELVSEDQRAVLEQLYDLPDEAFELTPLYSELLTNNVGLAEQERLERQRKVRRLLEDRSGSHAQFYREFGLAVPKALELYDSLGRFRDALLGHELESARDESTRSRLRQIVDKFSSCLP